MQSTIVESPIYYPENLGKRKLEIYTRILE